MSDTESHANSAVSEASSLRESIIEKQRKIEALDAEFTEYYRKSESKIQSLELRLASSRTDGFQAAQGRDEAERALATAKRELRETRSKFEQYQAAMAPFVASWVVNKTAADLLRISTALSGLGRSNADGPGSA